MTISCLAVYLKLQHPIWIVSDLLSSDLKKHATLFIDVKIACTEILAMLQILADFNSPKEKLFYVSNTYIIPSM